MSQSIKDDIKRYKDLKTDRASFDTLWQKIADYVMPRKSEILTEKTEDTEGYVEDLFDMTATQANMTLAAGIMTNAVPPTERWFAYSPPEQILNDPQKRSKASDWFEQCSAIASKELARSNFYTEFHEAMLNRNAFGTCAVHAEEGKRSLLNFRSFAIGTFVIDVDNEGYVDTIMRELQWTARQAKQEFGEAALGDKMKAELKESTNKKFKILHIIRPRADGDRDRTRGDPENKPIESKWISMDEEHELRMSGYDEMPTNVGRFLRWGDRAYGTGPGIQCLPVVRQVNFLEKKMDILAEKAADPPVLVPEGMIDEVDWRAGGETAFDPNTGAKPEEWMTQGRYDIGKDRVEIKTKFIEKCFHNELFQMFANVERQITATEAMARLEEKLDVFSPTFQRITTELLQPILARVFSLLFRAGVFPDPPQEAFVQTATGFALPLPEVVFSSKLALALKAKENGSLQNTMATLADIAVVRPDVLDIFDFDTIGRDVAHNNSLPPRWTFPDEIVDGIRAERAAAQQAEQEAALAASAAATAKDLGQAPKELLDQAL